MKQIFLLATAIALLTGCATYEGGTVTESGVVRGAETDETTSDFGRGEGWRNQRDSGAVRDPRPAGGFHH